MNECMKQLIEAVQSGQLDPNMTLGQLTQELTAAVQGGGQPGVGQPQVPQPQDQRQGGLGQVQ